MKLVGYLVIAVAWALVLAQLLWRYSRQEFPAAYGDSTGPDAADAALATLYGFLWPLTLPAFVLIRCVLQVSRWLSRLVVTTDTTSRVTDRNDLTSGNEQSSQHTESEGEA